MDTRYQVSTGPHEVLVSDARYYDSGKQVQVDRGESEEMEVELMAREGGLVVNARDDKGNDLAAEVWLDDVWIGTTPLAKQVLIGRHKLRVVEAGRQSERDVEVKERQVEEIGVELKGGTRKASGIGVDRYPNCRRPKLSAREVVNYGKNFAIRENSIEKMRALVENNPRYPNLADLLFRIAEFVGDNTHYKLNVTEQETGTFRPDYSETLPVLRRIVKDYPNYPKIDEVLFMAFRDAIITGRSLGDQELVDEAIKYRRKLVKHFAQSPVLKSAAELDEACGLGD